MLIFHEGMPGSGKSYAAMVDHILSILKKGRKVYARMNGLDRDRMAEAGELDRESLDRLLIEVGEDEVLDLCRVKIVDGQRQWNVDADSLVVLDELQNFFPSGRAKLDKEHVQFFSEHRQRGLDILCMGQLLKDCHKMIVNRVNRKVQFLNKDVVGKPMEYKWKIFNGKPDDNGNVSFTLVTDGDGTYDPKYFGTYASYQEGTENTERLADDRVVIWKSPVFRKWLPILGLVSLVSVGYLIHLFSGGLTGGKIPEKPKPQPVAVVTEIEETGKPKRVIVEGELPKEAKPEKPKEKNGSTSEAFALADYVTDLSEKNRIRLVGILRGVKQTKIVIEWRDASNQVIESLSGDDLRALGWSVLLSESDRMAILARPGKQLVATGWPIPEPVAKVSHGVQEQVREESKHYTRESNTSPGRGPEI